jgi:hypothetical protein
MTTFLKQKNCHCRKGEYCTNGLKCTEQNCFLLKSSTFVTRPLAIPIEGLDPLRSILASEYIQNQSLYSIKHRGSDDSRLNESDNSTELNFALKQK